MTNIHRNRRSEINRSAVLKVAAVTSLVVLSVMVDSPLATIASMWVDDLAYHLSNNTTWLGMTSSQRFAWSVIPLYYLVGLGIAYMGLYRPTRKRLFINKMDEGVVTYIHGLDRARGNIYDLATILFNGFRHMDWEDIPRPISKDYYEVDGRDMVVVYYRDSLFIAPWAWKRRVIVDVETIHIGVLSVWLSDTYEEVVRHPYNQILDHIVHYSTCPFTTAEPDILRFEKFGRSVINRMQVLNSTLMQSNPTIMSESIKSNVSVLTADRISEELELLSDAERRALFVELAGEAK